MNMSKPVVCCERCLVKIGRRSQSAARFWMNICEIPEGNPIIADDDYPAMSVLEEMGFLLTTDIEDNLIVMKILGKHYYSQGDYFLVCGEDCRA